MKAICLWVFALMMCVTVSSYSIHHHHTPARATIDRVATIIAIAHGPAYVSAPVSQFDKEAQCNATCCMENAQQYSIIRYTVHSWLKHAARAFHKIEFEFSSPFIVKPSLPIALRQLLI